MKAKKIKKIVSKQIQAGIDSWQDAYTNGHLSDNPGSQVNYSAEEKLRLWSFSAPTPINIDKVEQ